MFKEHENGIECQLIFGSIKRVVIQFYFRFRIKMLPGSPPSFLFRDLGPENAIVGK